MKKGLLYLCLFTKRQLKQLSFLGILLIFPIFTFFFAKSAQTQDSSVRVALFSESGPESSISDALVHKMTLMKGNFTFYRVESSAKLYEDVSTSRAECGYILPADLFEQLDKNKKNKLVDVVVSPSTALAKIINETVYAEIFEEYSLHLLQEYLADKTEVPEEQITSLYRMHMTDGSTFSFAYDTQTASAASYQASAETVLLAPVRGFLSVLIFLSGFCGAVNYYKDRENHVFDNRRASARRCLQLLSVSIPVLLASVTGLLCLLSAGLSQGLWLELSAMSCYAVLVILFCTLLSLCFKNKLLFYSTIPVFAMGSLIFTPVFLDVSLFLPMLKPLSRLFLPYYYLLFF